LKRLIFFVLFFVHTALAYASGGDIVAKVGSDVLTKADFESLVSYYSVERKKDLSKDEKFRKDLLDILVKRMALAAEAREKGIDKRADVKNLISIYTNGILMTELIKAEVTDKAKVDNADLEVYYKTHESEFKHPQLVRVRHILIKATKDMSDEDKAKAKKKAEDLLAKIRSGGDFEKLASEFSEDDGSKARGGDLGFLQMDSLPKPFEKVAISLKPGEVGGPVETSAGYHIIKMEEMKDAGVWPLENVKEQVREKVLRQIVNGKAKEYVEKVVQESKIEVHPELIAGEK
jgi:peptidyl-prolyl cis-trans isomerase C